MSIERGRNLSIAGVLFQLGMERLVLAYRTAGFEIEGQRGGFGGGRHVGDWSKCIGTDGNCPSYSGEDVRPWFGYVKDPVHMKFGSGNARIRRARWHGDVSLHVNFGCRIHDMWTCRTKKAEL